jgi:HSP20 family protein
MSYPVRPSRRGRRDPFASLEAMQERFNRMIGDAITGYRGRTPFWHPDIDIDETEDAWTVEVRLPGVAAEEVAIDVNDRELSIKTTKTEESSGRSRYSDFSYRLTVPSDVDVDAIDATMDHGLLVVRLPRTKTSRSRRISVARRIEQARRDEALPAGEPERPVSDVSEAIEADAQSSAAYGDRPS